MTMLHYGATAGVHGAVPVSHGNPPQKESLWTVTMACLCDLWNARGMHPPDHVVEEIRAK